MGDKMKILYIANDSVNHAVSIINELAKLGHKVVAHTMSYDYYDSNREIITHKNVTLYPRSDDSLVNPKLFFEQFRETGFDLVFTSTVRTAHLGHMIKKHLNIPWVSMILDVPTHLIKKQPERAMMWKQHFPLLKQADTIVFNTEIARDEFFKFTKVKYPNSNIIIYPTNLPEEFYKAGIGHPLKGDAKYVVSVCRLTPEKNCKIIPKALSLTKEKYNYVAIGPDQGELEEIKVRCAKEGIPFTHYSGISGKEKMDLIKHSVMMIYPQETEYIGGLPPYEGMFVGKPVLCPNYKVLHDLYGSNVCYYKKNDEKSLAIAIDYLATNDFGDAYNSVAEFAKRVCNYEVMANGLLKVFEDVLE